MLHRLRAFIWLGLISIGFSQVTINDPCFTSVSVGTSFAGSANISNSNADRISWNGSGWTGSWPGAGLTLPPPGGIVGTGAIWSGPNHWTTGGEGFGMRLSAGLVAGTTYSFSVNAVRHGWSGVTTWYPNVRTNSTGAVTGGVLVGTIPAVGTSWTIATITFTATAGQAGHNWLTLHSFDTGGMILACSPTPLEDYGLELSPAILNDRIFLKWSDRNPGNVKPYILERSTDGFLFEVLHESASGNTSFEDQTYPAGAELYYRIRQDDGNGTFRYSNVLSVTAPIPNGVVFNIFPNPVFNGGALSMVVLAEHSGWLDLSLNDLTGKTIRREKQWIDSGSQSMTLQMEGVEPGIYFLSGECSGQSMPIRKVVVK